MQILVDAAFKGAAVLMMATAATAMMRRTSAAMRHLVWVVAVSALLWIPALSFVLPAWQVLPAIQRSTEMPVWEESYAPIDPPAEAGPVGPITMQAPTTNSAAPMVM